jgi:hypothetical protein
LKTVLHGLYLSLFLFLSTVDPHAV